jgi:adenosylhomocysteine nucleosidase
MRDDQTRTMFSVGMIAIVAAMPEELAPLRARVRAARALHFPDKNTVDVVSADLRGKAVALAVTGDGERNARRGAAALESMIALQRLIVVGIAGAASDDLSPGALIVAVEVGHEGGASWRADPSCVAEAVRVGARPARLVSARRLADTPAAKRSLAGASGGSVAIDLESASYVEAAERAGVPWTVLRVISDAAHEALPPLLNQSRDAGGSVRRGAVALGLATNWRALPVLMRLRARLQEASVKLADAVEQLVAL